MKASAGVGFSSVYEEYERLSRENAIDISRRSVIRKHVERYLKPSDKILELNAGSGIDALYFANRGHHVLATDISDGSEIHIRNKIAENPQLNLQFERCSFENLSAIDGEFDCIFSNFGGLNCTNNLATVFGWFPKLVKTGGFVSLVIMPKCYPWEMATVLKGNKNAMRRWQKHNNAQVGQDQIRTFYHSPADVKAAFPSAFTHVKTVNIGTFYPSAHFSSFQKFPRILNSLIALDGMVNKLALMPKGIGDYFIITFKKTRE